MSPGEDRSAWSVFAVFLKLDLISFGDHVASKIGDVSDAAHAGAALVALMKRK